MPPIAAAPEPSPTTRSQEIRPTGHRGVRVHELAKELGIASKEVLNELRSLGEHVKSPSAKIDPSIVQAVRARRSGRSQNQ